jgi:cytoskeletal protein CcmA (bactofilin family)
MPPSVSQKQIVSKVTSNISNNTTITGDIVTDSTIRLDCQVLASITSQDGIILDVNAEVTGNLSAVQLISVSGTVSGNLTADNVHLLNTANVKGDISCNSLVVENGATFSGKISMPLPQNER